MDYAIYGDRTHTVLRMTLTSESHCNVAEVEFYNAAGTKISGTPFGASPSHPTNPTSTFEKAHDGNTATFFDYAYKHFGFTGLDLGAGNQTAIANVRYFPRAGQAARMLKGRFEGSNELPIVKTVVESVDIGYGTVAGGGETITHHVGFGYQTLPDPVLASDWLVLQNASYGDAAQAQYSYQVIAAGQRPLLDTMDDPRVNGKATKVRYEFWQNAYIHGSIYSENSSETGAELAKFVGVGATNYTNYGRKVTFANGQSAEFLMKADTSATVKDSFYRISWKKDAMGRQASFTYDTNGFIQTVTTPSATAAAGRVTTYVRDSKGRVTSVTWVDNSTGETFTRSWVYTTNGFLWKEFDERGKKTEYTRDAINNRITRIDYADSSYETFTNPNTLGQFQTHRLPNGGVEQFLYDAKGRLETKTDAGGYTTSYTYHPNESVETVTQSVLSASYNSVTTGYTYNDRRQVLTVTHFDEVLTHTYDDYGNRLTTTDGNWHTTSATYDEFKRMRSQTNAKNETTQYDYDEITGGGSCCGGGGASDRLTTITLPSGKKTRILYNAAGQKTDETMGFGTANTATTRYDYDLTGQLKAMTDPRTPNLWNHTFTYDGRGRRKTATTPAGTTTWNYDLAGNILSIQRPDGGLTVNTYDHVNRVLTTKDPANQTTTFVYGRVAPNDGGSTLHQMTDARGKTHTFLYDLRNLKTAVLYPDSTSESWGYDGAGNVTWKVERPGGSGSILWNYYYDPRNRETNRISSGGDPGIQPSWTDTYYYPTGIPAVIYNEASTIVYVLDDADRVTGELQDINPVAGVDPDPVFVNYTYDVDGNRQTMTYPGGTALTYTYTNRNQLDTITAGTPPPLVDYAYDEAGNRIGKTIEPGTAAQTDTTYHYDNTGRLDWLDHKKNGASFARFDYILNSVNNRTDRTETLPGSAARRDHYDYTADDQIDTVKYNWNQGASTQDRLVDYNFDAVGNRVVVADSAEPTKTFTVNDANQYVAATSTAGVETFFYMDTGAAGNRGNLLGVASNIPGSLTQKFKYDHVGRLIKTWKEDGIGGQYDAQLFYYDGRNRCVARNVVLNYGGTNQPVAGLRTMAYDGWNLIEETRNSATTTYIHGAGVDEILVATDSNGTPRYHQHDGLGSVVALTDSTGTEVERYRYDVFGKPSFYDGANTLIAGATQSPVGNRFLYTGREQLTNIGADSLGLMDYRNRVYSTGLGRFLQTDPIRFDAGDINIYRYTGNSPVWHVDSYGLIVCVCPVSPGVGQRAIGGCVPGQIKFGPPLGSGCVGNRDPNTIAGQICDSICGLQNCTYVQTWTCNKNGQFWDAAPSIVTVPCR